VWSKKKKKKNRGIEKRSWQAGYVRAVRRGLTRE
jgi:hypothetical protein